MYKNYEKRVKDFIIDMSSPESKIEIKDLSTKIDNTRENLSQEKEIPIPFVVNRYSTEEERIKNTMYNNKYLYNLPDYDKIINEKEEKKKLKFIQTSPKINLLMTDINNDKNINDNNNSDRKFHIPAFAKNRYRNLSYKDKQKYNYLMKNDLIIQPQMRFKPRTDLERVYDVLNGYHYNEKEKAIVENQLKSIDLYNFKRPNDLFKTKHRNNKTEENISDKKEYKFTTEENDENLENKRLAKKNKELFKVSKLYYDPKKQNYKSWARQEDLNKGAYGILKDYHYKLYFKATEEIAENSRDKNKKNLKNKKCSNFLLPNLIPHKKISLEKKKKNDEDDDSENDIFKFNEEPEEQSEEDDYNNEYTNNINPLIEKPKIKSSPELMKELSKIAFKFPNRNSSILKNSINDDSEDFKKNINSKNEKHKNYIDDNHVLIGNQVFVKNTQLDMIASKVLEICKAHKCKSIYNNTSLKAKNGKTMITKGLTVGQFEKKYDL